ncbi:HEAT repeat domain-containing protein OS=Tsukamurella paurometabola (strain ATCC 8368 / DSM/ CCUG 35730 / CIP 100753 / JCM 10117 / KCTC 9821 / NBRC 16120/ NCIMB 702349 / NCTC 13040) OX=521096 GN=Tpau_3450 PE=4 SV=1 [Tsukamurella paurometabola]|uniref:HEAT repeat domain-containing protein n=2 Tax=Tsukamurella paurometabola TaxID=2061 RepID=D5UX14_TSUPD|nr:conserved hypothetical protein [Tsukamurella paurometabola DSM 20162]SUP38131.1 Uncharacterised protein [Tsukamurella paurometabola]
MSADELFRYSRMPEGEDWKEIFDRYPQSFVHGKDGFDRRLIDDLDAVGVRVTHLDHIVGLPTVPPAVGVAADWLTHLDERIPGDETRHKQGIRHSLINLLNDPAAKGNQAAIEALSAQIERSDPPLPEYAQIWAITSLARIATKDDYQRMMDLFNRPDIHDGGRSAIVAYFGRFRRPESREAALSSMDRPIVRAEAIRTLGKIGNPDDIAVIAPYENDDDPHVRRAARTALKRLRS